MAIPKEWKRFIIIMVTVLWTFFCVLLALVFSVILATEPGPQTKADTIRTMVDGTGLAFLLWVVGTPTVLINYFVFWHE